MLSARVRDFGATSAGTEPYSTDEVPLSAMPITGSSTSAASSGSGASARIPAAVKPSVSHTVPTAPMTRPDESACELARRAAGKNQRQRQTDGLHARALVFENERQEQQKAHACRAVDDAYRDQ